MGIIGFFFCIGGFAGAQESAQSGTVSKGSLVTARAESRLNETVLHSSILNYGLPLQITEAAQKCISEDPDECYFSFKFFENSTNPATAAAANVELALLSLQRGRLKQALAHIEKAAQQEKEDPFIELTRGWILFSAGKYKKAREAFADMYFLTADFEYVSSAKLGTALSYYYEGDKDKAATEFQYLYTSNPYSISFVSYMLGKISAEYKRFRKMAPIFLQQSLSHDSNNYAAVKLLASLNEKEKQILPAWQYYATLFTLDPRDQEVLPKIAKYAKKIGDKSIDYLFYLRLDQPMVHEMISTPSPTVKMALYADALQQPVALQGVTVSASGTVIVTEEKLGEVLKFPSYVEKKMTFNPVNNSIDFRDSKDHVEFSTRRPITLSLSNPNRTLLARSLQAENIFSANFSDKELKGSLTAIPTEKGILLVNNVYAEDLIPALLAAQAPSVKHEQAIKALAVVFRSALLEAVEKGKDKPYHITDNDEYFKFKGINLMFLSLINTTKASAALELQDTDFGYYANCGVVAYNSLENTAHKPNYVFSPANLSKYMISNPPADLFSKPEDPTLWSGVKWIYNYEGKAIANRVAYKKDIGKLKAIVPLKRTPTGRILSMRFDGKKGSYTAQTPQEVSFILSAGTMRSNLFDIIPIYKGKYIKEILVRGYDTGFGVGLCLQGADGMAKDGDDFHAIIKYYFPDARIINTKTGTIQ